MAGAAGIAIEVGVAARAPLAVWPLDDSNRCFQLSSTVERSRRYCWYSSSSSQLLTPISGPDFDAMGRENAFPTMRACGGARAERAMRRSARNREAEQAEDASRIWLALGWLKVGPGSSGGAGASGKATATKLRLRPGPSYYTLTVV